MCVFPSVCKATTKQTPPPCPNPQTKTKGEQTSRHRLDPNQKPERRNPKRMNLVQLVLSACIVFVFFSFVFYCRAGVRSAVRVCFFFPFFLCPKKEARPPLGLEPPLFFWGGGVARWRRVGRSRSRDAHWLKVTSLDSGNEWTREKRRRSKSAPPRCRCVSVRLDLAFPPNRCA